MKKIFLLLILIVSVTQINAQIVNYCSGCKTQPTSDSSTKTATTAFVYKVIDSLGTTPTLEEVLNAGNSANNKNIINIDSLSANNLYSNNLLINSSGFIIFEGNSQFIANNGGTFGGALNTQFAKVSASPTLTLSTANTYSLITSASNTITAIASNHYIGSNHYGSVRDIICEAGITWVNSSSLVLQGSANYTTALKDKVRCFQIDTSGTWYCYFELASGKALNGAATQTIVCVGTNTVTTGVNTFTVSSLYTPTLATSDSTLSLINSATVKRMIASHTIAPASTTSITAGYGITSTGSAPSYTISTNYTAAVITTPSTSTLSAAAPSNILVTGTSTGTVTFPVGTTLRKEYVYYINNNSTGNVTVNKGDGTLLTTMAGGSYIKFILTDSSTTAGTWDYHAQLPSNATFGSGGMNITGSLTATSTFTATNVPLDNNVTAIAFNFYEGGGVLATGAKNYVVSMPYGGNITGYTLWSTSGGTALNSSTVMDIWKTTTGTLPTVSNTIFSGNNPTLTSASYTTSSALSINVATGDVIIVAITSNTAATDLNFILNITKN